MELQTVNGRYGSCTFIRGDEYLGRSMFSYGEYNREECSRIVSLASGLVIDVGANIGCISQALEFNGFEVVAFEPQVEVFNCLRKNISGECYNVALGSKSGEAYMPFVDYSKKGNYGGLGIGGFRGNVVQVKTLDSYNFQEVGLIKIDVEGYEEEVLRGAVETIDRCRPILYVEADRLEKLDSLRRFIVSLGYSIEEHNPPLFSMDNYFGLKRNIWGKNFVSKNWECKPLESIQC